MTATGRAADAAGDGGRPAARRPRRRAGGGADRRRRHELPRLPAAASRDARRRRPRRVLRSVDRSTVDALRRHVRPRRRCRGDAVHAAGARHRRRLAHLGEALDARAARPRAVRRRAAVRHDLAGDDPAVLRRAVRRRCGAVHVADAVGRHGRDRRRPRRRRHRVVAARAPARRARHDLAHGPGRRLATRPAVRHVRQRLAPAAAVAGVLLRRHRRRSRAGAAVVAPGGDRRRRHPVRRGDDGGRRRDRRARRPAGHRAVQPRAAVHGQRARHRPRRVRRHHVAGRALAGLAGGPHAWPTPAP